MKVDPLSKKRIAENWTGWSVDFHPDTIRQRKTREIKFLRIWSDDAEATTRAFDSPFSRTAFLDRGNAGEGRGGLTRGNVIKNSTPLSRCLEFSFTRAASCSCLADLCNLSPPYSWLTAGRAVRRKEGNDSRARKLVIIFRALMRVFLVACCSLLYTFVRECDEGSVPLVVTLAGMFRALNLNLTRWFFELGSSLSRWSEFISACNGIYTCYILLRVRAHVYLRIVTILVLFRISSVEMNLFLLIIVHYILPYFLVYLLLLLFHFILLTIILLYFISYTLASTL